jgi:hypothetical protein
MNGITLADVQALVQLLERTPLTQAEALWAQGLVARLQVAVTPPSPT